MKTILHIADIHAQPEAVFTAINTVEGLSKWWTPDVKNEGDVIHFHFMEGMSPEMKVTKREANTTIHWECVGGHEPWIKNTFSFDLAGGDGHTKLKFVQNYTTEVPDEMFGVYNFNWGYYLTSLKAYCETGEGSPFEG